MKNLLNPHYRGTLGMHFVLLILVICMKNDDANSQVQAAIQSNTQKQAIAKTSSETRVALVSASKAIAEAQQNGDYLAILFYEKKDNSFQEMQQIVRAFSKRSPKAMKAYVALTTDNKESDVIQKYGVKGAPLPLLLVFAPNGAVTGGFPAKVTDEQLSKCLVPKLVMNILKSVQAGKVALVSLQDEGTKFNTEASAAAYELSKDERLKGYVDIIRQDPHDNEIKEFLSQCRVDQNMKEAATVVIVPPGKIGGVYSGKITKDTLITCLVSCSGGGCCPK